MKLFIMTDLEGVSGVDSIEMIGADTNGYQIARKNLMHDVNAAIAGAFEGGADEVCVLDGHGTGLNFIKDMLDPRAVQLTVDEYFRTPLEKWDIDAFFSIGAHAMAGTVNAFLDHTQSSAAWFDFSINGKSYGEIGQQASFFGLIDLPLLMVSGDEAVCREAEVLVPGVVTACVKTASARNKAECIDIEEARTLIFNSAKEAISKVKSIKPYKIDLPATVEVTFTRNDYCDDAMARDPKLIRNGRKVTRYLDRINCCLDFEWF